MTIPPPPLRLTENIRRAFGAFERGIGEETLLRGLKAS